MKYDIVPILARACSHCGADLFALMQGITTLAILCTHCDYPDGSAREWWDSRRVGGGAL